MAEYTSLLSSCSAKQCVPPSRGPSGLPAARPVGVAEGIGRRFTSLCARRWTHALRIVSRRTSARRLASLIRKNMADQVR